MNLNSSSFLTVVAVAALYLSASAEIEYLDYVDTTGSQWVDTGILPNAKRTEMEAVFAVLEYPDSPVGLFGAYNFVNQGCSWEDNWSWLSSQGCRIGKVSSGDRYFLPDWTGSSDSGYHYPNSGNFALNRKFIYKSKLSTSYLDGNKQGGGYNDNFVRDYDYAPGKTLYIGNVNNAGTGLFTPLGSMPKVRWYAFRVWRDGALVGEFLPAKEGASVGFYDTFSKRMFTSESEDAFVEPEVVVWKGGGTTPAWSDGSNWEGNVPPEAGQLVKIPDNCKALARADDVATMNAYFGVIMSGDDSVLSFSNLTAGVEKTLSVPIRGKGLILVEQAASTGDQRNLRISGDNSRFSGDVRAERAGLSVGHCNALGIGGTFTANMTGSQRVELNFSGAMPNDCYLGGGMLIPGSANCNPELSGAIHLTGTMTLRGYASSGTAEGWLIMSGNLIRDVNKELTIGDAVDFRVPGLDLSTQTATVWANGGTKRYRGGIRSLGKTAYAEGTWICTAENAFAPRFDGSIRLGTNNKDLKFDLNGFDQQYGTMHWKAANAYCPNFIIKSATPATLTIYGMMRNDSLENTYCGCVNGAASIELNSTNSTTVGTAKFAFGQSETTGGFTARRGTIELQSTTSFSNLTHLIATETGLLKVKTSDIGLTTNLLVSVTNATSAKIEIAANVTLTADVAFMGNNWLSEGLYSSVAGPGVRACPQLSGSGVLEVKRYGGPKGLLLIFR